MFIGCDKTDVNQEIIFRSGVWAKTSVAVTYMLVEITWFMVFTTLSFHTLPFIFFSMVLKWHLNRLSFDFFKCISNLVWCIMLLYGWWCLVALSIRKNKNMSSYTINEESWYIQDNRHAVEATTDCELFVKQTGIWLNNHLVNFKRKHV